MWEHRYNISRRLALLLSTASQIFIVKNEPVRGLKIHVQANAYTSPLQLVEGAQTETYNQVTSAVLLRHFCNH